MTVNCAAKTRLGVLALGLLLAPPAAAEEQPADYARLLRGYVDTFRILGRAKACRLDFDPAPFRREVARRHGERSEAIRVAELGYAAGAEDLRLDAQWEPVPRAPMPCDVVPYMKDMRLPDLPASLVRKD